ncbi:hypothetical protein BCV70DRAFT_202703 [Testicularia cyperi]|uniref:HPP transmembrane region domain-containing protein n=1 Tax=Testicularia cyperi TaxID=1882483 RepID=A0A317XK36_9BASI|nr:hypothetical protein BCV70DRAFT_202703 [Testicularia cyperi]
MSDSSQAGTTGGAAPSTSTETAFTSRSQSRGRAEFTRGSVAPSSRTSRSRSRASFLGRPRQRTFRIYEADELSPATRRSDSRTVRDSLDDDGFAFSDDDHGMSAASPSKLASHRATKKARSTSNIDNDTHSKSTQTSHSTASEQQSKGSGDPEKQKHSQSNGQQSGNAAKSQDVEAQTKSPPKPVSRLSRIPYPIAHFLGYRSKKTEGRALIRPIEKLPRKIETLIWGWIGAMLGLGFVMITFSRWDQFASSSNDPVTVWTAPIIIGSFGASSVILYGTPASPLGQPKAFVGGQFICALVSICITKLFELNHNYNPDLIDSSHSLVWVAGGIAAGTALCAMILTDTVHPPGGATALLGATSPPVIKLGWRYIPVVLLSSVIMEAWAMLWMNLGRAKYPHFWLWPPGHPNDQRDFRIRFPGFQAGKRQRNRDRDS